MVLVPSHKGSIGARIFPNTNPATGIQTPPDLSQTTRGVGQNGSFRPPKGHQPNSQDA